MRNMIKRSQITEENGERGKDETKAMSKLNFRLASWPHAKKEREGLRMERASLEGGKEDKSEAEHAANLPCSLKSFLIARNNKAVTKRSQIHSPGLLG